MSKNVVIFAGAGASKAVNAKEFPTTVEFFDKLPATITENPLFTYTVSFVRNQKGETIVDIEEVLWTLQELRNFCKAYADKSTFTGFMLQKSRLARLISANHNFGHLDQVLNVSRSQADDLIDQVNAQVYQYYAYEPDESEISTNWSPLLGALKTREWRTDIVTTNYDTVIETAISDVHGSSYDSVVGLKGRTRKQLDLSVWQSPHAANGLLTKIHGSLDWQISGKNIFVGSPVYTGDHAKHAIIYPGFKGTETADYFALMHRYFGDRIEEADVIIFIGFAFRDDYVNRILDRAGAQSLILVVNPIEPKDMPTRGKVRHIKAGFDKKSVSELLASL